MQSVMLQRLYIQALRNPNPPKAATLPSASSEVRGDLLRVVLENGADQQGFTHHPLLVGAPEREQSKQLVMLCTASSRTQHETWAN